MKIKWLRCTREVAVEGPRGDESAGTFKGACWCLALLSSVSKHGYFEDFFL